jgi:hypothetical protein
MKPMSDIVDIRSRDYWVKVVGMLEQNWALIETGDAASAGVRVFFVGDTSGVFDEMSFPSGEEAIRALRNNGFRRYADDRELQSFLVPPEPPFERSRHPNGAIYSSGRYWRQ